MDQCVPCTYLVKPSPWSGGISLDIAPNLSAVQSRKIGFRSVPSLILYMVPGMAILSGLATPGARLTLERGRPRVERCSYLNEI